jgi:hypothetical protein
MTCTKDSRRGLVFRTVILEKTDRSLSSLSWSAKNGDRYWVTENCCFLFDDLPSSVYRVLGVAAPRNCHGAGMPNLSERRCSEAGWPLLHCFARSIILSMETLCTRIHELHESKGVQRFRGPLRAFLPSLPVIQLLLKDLGSLANFTFSPTQFTNKRAL